MAKVETQDPQTGEVKVAGQKGPEKKDIPLMDKLFEMLIGVLSLKVKSVRLHQAINVNGETKQSVDVDINKCKMMLTPFGVMIISKKFGENTECKRLISFNNCYEIEFFV